MGALRGLWAVVEHYWSAGRVPAENLPLIAAGSIHGTCHGDAVKFGWQGNDVMEPVEGDGWAEKDGGSLEGEICLLNADNIPFSACRSKTSSTAC